MLVTVIAASTCAAQIDRDWSFTSPDVPLHFAAGAGIQVATIILLPRARTWQRLAINATIQVTYELGQSSITGTHGPSGPGYGFSPKDLLVGMAGACLVEAVWRAIRK